MFKLRITGDLGFEVWHDIPGYEGKYQASTYGNIISLNYEHSKGWRKKLKTTSNNNNYKQVILYSDGASKPHLVHRLIAQTFIPKMNKYYEVNHKDENKANNRVENLEWCDRKYNNNYGAKNDKMLKTRRINGSKTAEKAVLQYTKEMEFIRGFLSQTEASNITHIRQSSISNCCNGRSKTAGGFCWTFKN